MMGEDSEIQVSVIVPAHNAGATLTRCLEALKTSTGTEAEILVVDDDSTDDTFSLAQQYDVHIFKTPHRQGPAGARNLGAEHARSPLLFFVDSDVVVSEKTVEKILSLFRDDPELAAVFGSYDSEPAEQNFLSQYRNLLHHFVHQNSSEEAQTFWAGCGAMRADIFKKFGGFDHKQYDQPSIEDIELGHRLWRAHQKIRLEKSLQVKHLKRWHALSLIKADILYRARPWSKLIFSSGIMPDDLNLEISQRACAVLTIVLIASPVISIFAPAPARIWLMILAVLSLVSIVYMNRRWYHFLQKKRGLLFALSAIPWHLLYYLYSSLTFCYYWVQFKLLRSKRAEISFKNAVVK